MSGNLSYAERQKGINVGEELFEAYCKRQNVRFIHIGFAEKKQDIPKYWELNAYLRNLPDYLVITKDKHFLVMVKGTSNMKQKEIEMIPQFLEWYGSKDVELYYAFCFQDKKNPLFYSPDRVVELYQKAQDKQWTDGKIYRTIF